MTDEIGTRELERLAALQGGRRRLSVDEVRYVVERAPSTTVREMAANLNIKWETLRARLDEMGVEAASGRDSWSEDDVAELRRLADEGWPRARVAEALGRSETAVRMAERRYGVTVYQAGRAWTSDEIDYLRRNWGRTVLAKMARYLHRDRDAVVEKAHRMRLGPVYGLSEDVPLSEFIRATGISRDRILGTLVPRDGFPVVRRRYGQKMAYWFVDFEKILDWMEAHQDLFDGSRVEPGFFVEPEWLRAKMRRDREDNSYLNWDVRRSYWTTGQISSARVLRDMGYSDEEIGARVGRSAKAVRYKLESGGDY